MKVRRGNAKPNKKSNGGIIRSFSPASIPPIADGRSVTGTQPSGAGRACCAGTCLQTISDLTRNRMAGLSAHSVPRVSRLLPMGEALQGPSLPALDVPAALGRAYRRSLHGDCDSAAVVAAR